METTSINSFIMHSSLEIINNSPVYRYKNKDEEMIFNIDGEEINNEDTKNEPILDFTSIFNKVRDSGLNVDIISEISSYIRNFVFLSDETAYDILSLLVIHSYCVSLFNKTPYLWINGEKGCGKTTLLIILKSIMFKPIFSSNISPSAIYRIINSDRPTLFLDELESLERRGKINDPIFQILNSGYQKDGTVTRTEGGKIAKFSTFCFKIMAGINGLYPALLDRCISINMIKPETNVLKNFTYTSSENLEFTNQLCSNIHKHLSKIAIELADLIKQPEKILGIERFSFRDLDKWFPILALAQAIKGDSLNFIESIHNFALKNISNSRKEEELSPEFVCKNIIQEFIRDQALKTKIIDINYFYFPSSEIQKVIKDNDVVNCYRDKSEITRTLKKIGIHTDRRRFGNGPVSLYKIPKSIFNHKSKE